MVDHNPLDTVLGGKKKGPHAHVVNRQSCHGVMQFDAAMNKALEKEVTTKATFKGHLGQLPILRSGELQGLATSL